MGWHYFLCFKVIREEEKLFHLNTIVAQQIHEELRHKPTLGNKIVKFLNSRGKEQLRVVGIRDRTGLIIKIKKVQKEK